MSVTSLRRVADSSYEHAWIQPVAKFIVSAWGDKVNCGIGCRTGPSGYKGWRAGTTTQCLSQLYPPVRDYEFGYRKLLSCRLQWPRQVLPVVLLRRIREGKWSRREEIDYSWAHPHPTLPPPPPLNLTDFARTPVQYGTGGGGGGGMTREKDEDWRTGLDNIFKIEWTPSPRIVLWL